MLRLSFQFSEKNIAQFNYRQLISHLLKVPFVKSITKHDYLKLQFSIEIDFPQDFVPTSYNYLWQNSFCFFVESFVFKNSSGVTPLLWKILIIVCSSILKFFQNLFHIREFYTVKCNTLHAINRRAHIVRRLKSRDNLYTKWQRLCQARYDEIIAPLATRTVHPLTFNIRVYRRTRFRHTLINRQ